MIHALYKQTCYVTPSSTNKNVPDSVRSELLSDAGLAARRGPSEITGLYESPVLADTVNDVVHSINQLVN
jgi:hypothetical protein